MVEKLTKAEKKIINALWWYPYADIGDQELNGYLHFPPIETILSALYQLERKGLIEKSGLPNHGYHLTENGKNYKKNHKSKFLESPIMRDVLIGTISSAIGGILAAIIITYIV